MGRHKRPWGAGIIVAWFLVVIAAIVIGLIMTDSPLLK